MKFLLIGAGGVGIYFCGRAVMGGTDVEVVARSGFDQVKEHGYQVQSIAGDFCFRPRVTASVSECSADIDAVILATKVLPDIDRVKLLECAAGLPSHPPIVLIQNGIGIENEIAAAYPDNEIISVIAYIGVSRENPGRIVHHGAGKLLLGKYNSSDTVTAERIADCFRAGGVECRVTGDIALERWRKLLWNLPFNPVSVLAGGVDTVQMCDRSDLENLCTALMKEVAATARAAGVMLTDEMITEQLEYTRNFPAYRTSMLQDFTAGRPLEVDAIIGNAVKIADKYGVPVPVMRCCAALLKSMDKMQQERRLVK